MLSPVLSVRLPIATLQWLKRLLDEALGGIFTDLDDSVIRTNRHAPLRMTKAVRSREATHGLWVTFRARGLDQCPPAQVIPPSQALAGRPTSA